MPANKALALLKLQKYTSAESNCSLALTLDDCYLKAYFHRGTARVKLGKIEEARDDFTVALRLEPGNKSARSELDKLNKESEKRDKREHSIAEGSSSATPKR
ncbi:RNA polymerase II-associated protein 3-like [Halichondria panicea]|uniref:RNA polymerase II-associated protein 3-like n=1 Tax=Halichondria panicea TaxID=6063 RepID=UPI00312B71F7